MNAAELIAVISSAVAGPPAQPGEAADPFRAALRTGDVVEGRVLRAMGPGRYAVDFGGFERIVDSTIPFRADEILYGRVVAIGDRVELQRVRADAAVRESAAMQSGAATPPAAAPLAAADALAASRGRWSPEEWKVAERLADDAGESPLVSLASHALARTGLPFSRSVLQGIHAMLARRAAGGLLPTRPSAIRVDTASTQDGGGARDPLALAERLRSEFGANRGALLRAPNAGDGEFGEAELGALLNVQADGPVAHAIATLPLVVDGRLLEVDLAFFQQDRDSGNAGELPHGKVVIGLSTDRLGRVEVDATLVGHHLQLALGSDDPGATGFMARYDADLRAEIEAGGWQVDEILYRPGDADAPALPARVVLEHLASRDSFSRLV
jgi:hypothetical protein